MIEHFVFSLVIKLSPLMTEFKRESLLIRLRVICKITDTIIFTACSHVDCNSTPQKSRKKKHQPINLMDKTLLLPWLVAIGSFRFPSAYTLYSKIWRMHFSSRSFMSEGCVVYIRMERFLIQSQ